MSELIQLKNIAKNFGPVKALTEVNLNLRQGEILALVGENGAGKSTLMKILGGIYPFGSYHGTVLINEKESVFKSTLDSEKSGIALIHQELSNFSHLTVAENLMVGHWAALRQDHWAAKFGWINSEQIYEKADQLLAPLGVDFSSRQKMSELSVGQQQLVEIAKALSKRSEILILDEPTSSLSNRETEKLFKILKELRSQGRGLIYISHRMEEIFSLCDRVIVLRDGQSVFTSEIRGLENTTLIKHMVGRTIDNFYPASKNPQTRVCALELKNFTARDRNSNKNLGPLNLKLQQGEILGFGGLLGAGRSELLQALCGDEKYELAGEVRLDGKALAIKNLRHTFQAGFGLVPEDRKIQSILPTRSLTENTGLLRLSQKPHLNWVSASEEDLQTQTDLKVLNTRFNSVAQKITELSGGNQQKVIFARILQNYPQIIVLDEPTRGVDVGAKFEIYQLMRQWTNEGKSILLISSDLPELMAMSDRILVMAFGKIQGELNKSDFNQEKILSFALKTNSATANVTERSL